MKFFEKCAQNTSQVKCKIESVAAKHHIQHNSVFASDEKNQDWHPTTTSYLVHEILPSSLKFSKEWFVEKSPFWREKNVLSRLENEVDFFSFLLDRYDRLC